MILKKATYCAIALVRDITEKRIIGTASNLTYSTLLAFVPIMAVVFAIARGFGYSVHIEDWFRHALEAQPAAAETIIGFVNSYLVHTKQGLFLGLGLLFMLWTVLMLIDNIEQAFNDIWQVARRRSLFRTVTDYLALLFAVPFVIVVNSGLSIFVAAALGALREIEVIGTITGIVIEVMPYVLWSAAFTALYAFMPNTRVRLTAALLPGCLAGVCMQLLQVVYINSQIWISNYNAIYGSFAIIPFFLLWLQASWVICLIGAELTYCRQNAEDFFAQQPVTLSFNERADAAWSIVQAVSARYAEGLPPLTQMEIKQRTALPMRHTAALLNDLQRAELLASLAHDDKADTAQYLPAHDIAALTAQDVRDALANLR